MVRLKKNCMATGLVGVYVWDQGLIYGSVKGRIMFESQQNHLLTRINACQLRTLKSAACKT